MLKHKKIVSLLLVFAMVLPLAVTSSLTADAALQENARVTFDEALDFENASAGSSLTQDYVNNEFYAPFSASTLSNSDMRGVGRWKVEQENSSDGSKNKFIALDDEKYPYGSFAIEDEDLMLWDAPFELSFDVRYKSFSINDNKNRDTTLVYLYYADNFASSVRLLGVSKSWDGTYIQLKNAYNENGTPSANNNGTAIGRLDFNEWYNVKIKVYTDTGRVVTYLDDVLVDSSIADTFVEKKIHGDATTKVTGSGISIGAGWGSPTLVDMDIDNIRISTFVDETETFDNTVIAGAKNSYLNSMLNDTSRFAFTVYTDAAYKYSYFSLKKESSGNTYLRQYVNKDSSYNGSPTGYTNYLLLTHRKATGENTFALQNEAFEISVDYRWDGGRTGHWWNPVRLEYGSTTFVPLRMNGATLSIAGGGYTVLRKTGENTFKSYTMPEDVWHKFRFVINPNVDANGKGDPTLEIYMTVGNGKEEQLYFPSTQLYYTLNNSVSRTFTSSEVTTAEKLLTHSAALEMSQWTKCNLYFAHGTSNGFMNFTNGSKSVEVHDWHIDNVSVKTINSDTVNEFIDFEGEEISGELFNDSSFVTSNPPLSGMKITDWEVTTDPVANGTRGNVLHTIPHTDLYRKNMNFYGGSTYAIVDSENALLGHEFEMSFDLNVARAPENWINLLKVNTDCSKKADGSYSNGSKNFTLLRIKYNGSTTSGFLIQTIKSGNVQLDGKVSTNNPDGLGFSKSFKTGEWVNFKTRLNPSTGAFSLYINGEEVFKNNINIIQPTKFILFYSFSVYHQTFFWIVRNFYTQFRHKSIIYFFSRFKHP